MAAAGSKRRLPEDEEETASGRPHKRVATLVDKSLDIYTDTASQDRSTQSSRAEHTPKGDLASISTQPTSQENLRDSSPPEQRRNDRNELPRIRKRPAGEEAPRPRKRPGAGARVDKARSDAILEKRKRAQEEETLKVTLSRGGDEFVKQHYNLVPQRGRDWRNTESKIKGLRKYNNWVKSVIINRFSQPDDRDGPYLKVLDMGCGKGGDLQKWHSTPHPVELYVGIDPAEVSIDQARDRYAEMRRGGGRGGRGGRGGWRGGRQQAPLFEAEFVAQDAFGHSVANVPVVQHVGFDAAGNSRWGGGGFDVVSMMFCMHYAFESEAKTRGMLTNVAGSLKKGGRFIGVIPNSDVIRSRVEQFHAGGKRQDVLAPLSVPLQKSVGNSDRITLSVTLPDPPMAQPTADSQVSVPDDATLIQVNKNVRLESPSSNFSNEKHLDGDKTTVTQNGDVDGNVKVPMVEDPATAEWGNDIYRVRFPAATPEDGIFRPPFGWKYNYFMEEAVEEVPEYVVPWEAFRA